MKLLVIGLVVGFFIGGITGLLASALCNVAAYNNEEYSEQDIEDLKKKLSNE